MRAKRLLAWLCMGSLSLAMACGSDDGDKEGAGAETPPTSDEQPSTPPPTPPPPAPAAAPAAPPPAPPPPPPAAADAGMGDAELDDDLPVVLPDDGDALSVCATHEDCNGDDLRCVAFETYRGYCAEDCGVDADCGMIDGLQPHCTPAGTCMIDCEEDGNGRGECPTHMACVEVVIGLLESAFTCQYPEPKDTPIYEPCDGLRGDSDCQEGLTCDVPVGLPLLSELASPYCAEICAEDSDCEEQGTDATPVCDHDSILVSEGQCALKCADDKDCPGEMLCVAIDPLASRCGYPVL